MTLNSVPMICILGDSGAGKTRLSSLYPDTYCLDTEQGGASAFPDERRKQFSISPNTLSEVRTEIKRLHDLPYADRHIVDENGVKYGAVSLDSLDAVQQEYKSLKLSAKTYKDPRKMWGDLLDDLLPLIYDAKKLPVPFIFVTQVKQIDPVYWEGGEHTGAIRKFGVRSFATQGSIDEQMIRWFDYILHLVIEEDYKRRCFIQPTIYKEYRITAKDRHNIFSKVLGKDNFVVEVDEAGFPKTKAMEVIYNAHAY